jgi:TrmH family RNA methyltransferase
MSGGQALHTIESPANPRARLWLSLLDGRGIRKHRRFLLSGRKAVPEALARHPDRFETVLAADPHDLDGWRLPPHVEPVHLARALFDALDIAGTHVPLLVGIVPDMPKADLSLPPVGLELICALGDPANLGALLRSAAAFGAGRIVLLDEAANPFHPKCLRAAANAPLALSLTRGPRWEALDRAAGPIAALDGTGADLAAFAWPRDLRLVLGEEGQGLPAGLAIDRLAIPTTGAVESLNATVAASIALFAWYAATR